MEIQSKNRTIAILLILVLSITAQGQRLFYCDSTLNVEQKRYESTCKEYYDFTSNKVDSIIKVNLSEGYGYSIPIQISAPVNQEMKIHGNVFGLKGIDTIFKIEYKNGLPNGYYIRFCDKDTLSITEYKNGKKQGIEVFKPVCGSTIFFTKFINNIEIGPSIEVRNRKFRGLTAISHGLNHGAQYRLDENGTLEWLLIYENGKVKDGTYYHFDENGKIIQADTYKKGKLRKTIQYYDYESPKVTRYK